MYCETPRHIAGVFAKASKAKIVALDTETTGLDWKVCTCLGLSMASDSKAGHFLFMPSPANRRPILAVTADPKIAKVFHNAKFDLHFLKKSGIRVAGPIYDTFFLMKLLDENRPFKGGYKLKPLAAEFFDPSGADAKDELDEWLKANGKTYGELKSVPKALLAKYGAEDARITLGLYEVLRKKLAEAGIPDELIERESKTLSIAFLMEEKGIRVNRPFLEKYKKELQAEQAALYKKMRKFTKADFNPDSDVEAGNILKQLGWKPARQTDTGQDAVDKEAVAAFDHDFARALLEHRRVGTIRGTFVEGILERAVKRDGEWTVHCEYHTSGAATGRWSSANPNLQNVDKKSRAREAFIPRKNHEFWAFDYKQIEPVLFAHFSGVPRLLEVFQKGLDYHLAMASAAYDIPYEQLRADGPERKVAKNLGLAILYQAGADKAAKMMGVPVSQGRDLKARLLKNFPEIKQLQKQTGQLIEDRAIEAAGAKLNIVDKWDHWEYEGKRLPMRQVPKPGGGHWEFVDKDAILEYGYIKNPFGRLRRLQIKDGYKALNALIQGTAADLLKEALVRCQAIGFVPLLQVHDELVFELPKKGAKEAALQIRDAMESVGELFPNVPIRVDVARSVKNWASEVEVKLPAPKVKPNFLESF